MTSETRRPITPQELFRLRVVQDPHISPDGRHVAFIVKQASEEKNTYEAHIWLVEVEGRASRPFTYGAHRDASPRWSPDGTQLVFISDRGKPGSQLYLISRDGGEARPLTALDEGDLSSPCWSPDGSRIVFVYRPAPAGFRACDAEERKTSGGSPPPRVITRLRYREEGTGYFGDERAHVRVVTVADGSITQVTDGPYDAASPCWSPDGSCIAFVANRDEKEDLRPNARDIYVVPDTGGTPRRIEAPQGPKDSLVWSPDGRYLAYIGHDQPDEIWGVTQAGLWVVSLEEPRAENLTRALDRPVGDAVLSDLAAHGMGWPGPAWTDDGASLSFLVSDRGGVHLYAVSVEGGDTRPLTEGSIHVAAVTGDRTGRRLALLCGNTTAPADVYTIDLGTPHPTPVQVTDVHRGWLDGVRIADSEEIRFSADDGVQVQGWLMKPPDFDPGRNHPLVLEIHGGPHAQYGHTFFHEFQVLAARGYCVLYVNPRGSKGYGEAFASAIRGRWGERDYQDLMQALDHVLDTTPGIDPGRLGVTGGSYGGYMTNWVVGHTQRFRGAVTQRSVVNLHSMAGTCDYPLLLDPTYFDANAWDMPDAFLAQSPLSYAARIRTPLLIIHSEGDLRCPIEQGEQLFAALKALGREAVFVRYPAGADHNLSRTGPPDLRIDRLTRLVEWMDRYVKPSP